MPLSAFSPLVQTWFRERVGEPTPPQRLGWPAIQAGRHALIAAPTGTGKTLAAFLAGLDGLLRRGSELPDATLLLYISPLKALSNDVQKNLQGPLEELRARDPSLPEVRVLVRTGDTGAKERQSMRKQAPHVLVTTPESLFILLTSQGGRDMLRTVETVIVDEIHALAGNKRGAHLALSLERLEALVGATGRPLQRIGLSATQRPLDEIARFLVGVDRTCEVIDVGHKRAMDLAVVVPESPLEAVCSHEAWGELYREMTGLIGEHRTTLLFVNTRKMAERISARLAELLGEDKVACHHGSLARERRLQAEQRLKRGELRALVATASLELGIDIGDVDLVIQIGGTRSIATFLQRVGRAGHGVGRTPKGRLFPLTKDELVEAAALLCAVRRGELDRIELPEKPLDILAQQVVAACVPEAWEVPALFERLRRAWPYRELTRAELDEVIELHGQKRGRGALLHRDGVGDRLLATRRARLVAIMSGGAIPDTAQYRVLESPHDGLVGTIDEDFAVEAMRGDVFQLGTASWQILKIEPGTVHVAAAPGAPPTVPFWLGEAPARTSELSAEVARLREEWEGLSDAEREGLPPLAQEQITTYLAAGRAALGAVPTQRRLIAERFFDESGGTQLILHAPFGGRINRALGLTLRKTFCRRFGFELQAAANEDAIVLSLGPHQSFPLEEVFDYLKPATAQDLLVQALLVAPMFATRWRWNVTRSLLVPRMRGGKKVPANLIRMRAEDELVQAFPAAQACPETLPGGPVEVPMEHPLVRQTVLDCLHEAMDVDGFLAVVQGLVDGTLERVARDTPEPSPFAEGILAAQPYAFLDDAPLEERRVQAVLRRQGAPREEDGPEELDPAAVARVREEVWPEPRSAEEVHEALLWMGYLGADEAPEWAPWLAELERAGRVVREGERWFATEASREPREVWRGRLEVLGPVHSDDPELIALEVEGVAVRTRFQGRAAWCHRRLLARIQRAMLDRLRREVEPVSAATLWRFLAVWQGVAPGAELGRAPLEGPQGVLTAIEQLAGWEAPAVEWELSLLPVRVAGYQRAWLDELTLSGRVAWGRLWGSGAGALRLAPLTLVPREHLDLWLQLAGDPLRAASAKAEARIEAKLEGAAEDGPSEGGLQGPAAELLELLERRGALFPQDLERQAGLLPEHLEAGLSELIARGLVTCDGFSALRALLVPASRRRHALPSVGRWSLFRAGLPAPADEGDRVQQRLRALARAESVARVLLRRYGVVFKRLLVREHLPVPWQDILRALRALELRGEVRGGRFASGFWGEQYALPEAVSLLRRVRRAEEGQEGQPSPAQPQASPAEPQASPAEPQASPAELQANTAAPLQVSAADPLNLQGILNLEERVARTAVTRVLLTR